MSSEKTLYRVTFHNLGQVFEVYAREVGQGGMYGFIEIQGLVFGAKSSVVIDPSEDRLRAEFEGVERVHVPMHSVIRIDEVKKEGGGRILKKEETEGTIASFPLAIYTPSKDSEGA